MRRLAQALLLSLALSPAHAQLGDKVRDPLAGVSTSRPDHDTSYIATYRSNLVISLVCKWLDIDLAWNRTWAATSPTSPTAVGSTASA